MHAVLAAARAFYFGCRRESSVKLLQNKESGLQ